MIAVTPFVFLDIALLTVAFFVLRYCLAARRSSRRYSLSYPPGPPAWPIIGNVFDMPTDATWITYLEWAKKYGDVVHVNMVGSHIVILNSMRAAFDLLEKRSSIYSDRPILPYIELFGWDWDVGFVPYGNKWRRIRRALHQHFRNDSVIEFHPLIYREVREGCRRILSSPENFMAHIRLLTASTIMSIVYGYQVSPENDRYVEIVQRSVDLLTSASFPGASIINVFPTLKYLPGWLPGMGFKRRATECSALTREIQESPFRMVKYQMASGTAPLCVTTKMLENLSSFNLKHDSEEETNVIKPAVGVAYAAGADTTNASLCTAILAMVLHPAAQAAARAEIDSVVGRDRLPTFEDRNKLPYVEAFMWEIMRWRPVAPQGLSHATTEDDVYNGFFIPKGTAIIMNTWAIFHDPESYPNPDQFQPERFIIQDSNGGSYRLKDDYPIAAFGLGRRVCVGRHLADAELWCFIATALATFVFERQEGDVGDVGYTSGLVSHPLPFKCRITIRDSKAEALIRAPVEES